MISDETLKPIMAAQVRRLRQVAGMSQEALAAAVGVERATINRIEMGHRVPNAALLYSIADALNVSADDLRRLSEKAEKKLLALA